jgi:cell volume regulation protein A
MLSFNEFAEEDQLQFGKFEITENSKWLGRTVGEAGLPEGLSIAMVIRGAETLVPHSDLVLNEGDTVITLTRPFDEVGAMIKEKVVKPDSRRVGRPIKDHPGRSKILLVKRDDKSIIPDDNTILLAGDHLVILELQN